MKNKKGAELSLNFIIIAAIVLVVLIVAILFFTGAGKKLIGEQAEVTKLSTQEYTLALAVCKSSCVAKSRAAYESPSFTESLVQAGYNNCADLKELDDFNTECLGSCEKSGETDKNCAALSKENCKDSCEWKAGSA